MINIFIQAIGKERSAEMLVLQREYLKRMQWKININEYPQQDVSRDIAEIKKVESTMLLKNISNNALIIVLDELGEMYDSQKFADFIGKSIDNGVKEVAFLIGGAHGHSDELKSNQYKTISLSKMTLPHKLVRLILIEQLYRAYTIIIGHPYHKP